MKTYTHNDHLKIVINFDRRAFISAYDYESNIPIGDVDKLIELLESIQAGNAKSDEEIELENIDMADVRSEEAFRDWVCTHPL